jgi:hypothetical protein
METFFFLLSKLGWSLIEPEALLLYLLLLACWLLYRNQLRLARRIITLVLLLLLILAYLPLGLWLYAPLEHRFAANPPLPVAVDGIIVLGGALDPVLSAYWQQAELSDSAERQIAFATLARQYPSAKLVMTGGNGNLFDNQLREADYVALFLQQLQIDASRVLFERDSRNTYENALYSKQLANPQPGEVWVLVTSAGHMPRATGIFCKLNWPVLPWPVDHITAPNSMGIVFDLGGHLQQLNFALHEWLGLIAYYASGLTTALVPVQCTV